MYWIVVVIILAVAVWLGRRTLMGKCGFCGKNFPLWEIKLVKNGVFFSAACPRCAEEAEKEGWEELA